MEWATSSIWPRTNLILLFLYLAKEYYALLLQVLSCTMTGGGLKGAQPEDSRYEGGSMEARRGT